MKKVTPSKKKAASKRQRELSSDDGSQSEVEEEDDEPDDEEGIHAKLNARCAAADDERDFEKLAKNLMKHSKKTKKNPFIDDEAADSAGTEDAEDEEEENEEDEEEDNDDDERVKSTKGTKLKVETTAKGNGRRKDWYAEQSPKVEYDTSSKIDLPFSPSKGKPASKTEFNLYGRPAEVLANPVKENDIKSNIQWMKPSNFMSVKKNGKTKTFHIVVKNPPKTGYPDYVFIPNIKASGIVSIFRKFYPADKLAEVEKARNTQVIRVKQRNGELSGDLRGPIIPPKIFVQLMSERDAKFKKQTMTNGKSSAKQEPAHVFKPSLLSSAMATISTHPRGHVPTRELVDSWSTVATTHLTARVQDMASGSQAACQEILKNAYSLTAKGPSGFDERLEAMIKICLRPGLGISEITRIFIDRILPSLMVPLVPDALKNAATSAAPKIAEEPEEELFTFGARS